MPFKFERLEINGLVLVRPDVFKDERGFFMEDYKQSDFHTNGINYDFVQGNHSKSQKNVLRGLHYQLKPAEQGKLVRVIKGEIFDVSVDIRRDSPTYKKWVSVNLSEENKLMLFVPPGFAHGFVTLEDNTEVIYRVTKEYSKAHERGIIWNDPTLNIKWPIENPILSQKDSMWPELNSAESNF